MTAETFDLFAGEKARDAGTSQAAESKNPLLNKVRAHLRVLASARSTRCATADDATKFLSEIGEKESALGNAAGSIFLSAEWEPTGCWTPSTHVKDTYTRCRSSIAIQASIGEDEAKSIHNPWSPSPDFYLIYFVWAT
jgi:hypothetical protein